VHRLLTRSIGLLFLTGLIVLFGVAPAHADSDDDSITRFDIDAALKADGSLDVILDFDFDFGGDSGHGPFLVLPERMEIEGDPDHWRSLPVTDIAASSDTAPDEVQVEREGGAVEIRIGDEDEEIEGTHTYRVTYSVAGVVNPDAPGSGLDELSWNPIGNEWEIPLRDVAVSVSTPAEIERVACFMGSDYRTPCEQQPTADGSTASFAPGVELEPGDGLQVVAGMPAGSFPGVQPILTERYTPSRVLGLTPATSLASAAVLLLGAALAIVGVRRAGGDRQFAGVTPGLIPAAGAAGAPEERARKTAVAVQFQPPKAVTPGQVGVLSDTTADQQDVTATVIDLATRGYLRVEEQPDDEKSWRLVSTGRSSAGLRPYESQLLESLFADGDEVDLAEPGVLAKASTACQKELYHEVTDELGWFRGNPSTVRTRWVLAGTGALVLGVALVFALGFTVGLGLIGVAIGLVGVVVMIAAHWAPGRTATGTAVRAQALGFREYLETAEADQIRFEEGIDVFSRYLPYAMVWGLAERWTKIFADLAQRGTELPEPSWYVGVSPVWAFAGTGSGSFADAISGLDSAAVSAMTAPTSSSGGGSGFSGGGGVGGGGGGGW
jgi:hypothetical protein